jgi:hypothetical protein
VGPSETADFVNGLFWEPGLVERRIIADATNKLARAEVEQVAETHMGAANKAEDRPLLTHEPGATLDLDRRRPK